MARKSKAKTDRPAILASLGVLGLEDIEPAILAALVQEEPLLLVGPHGTGKSYLLNRLATALGLAQRHYNASLLNFDDLVGYLIALFGSHEVFCGTGALGALGLGRLIDSWLFGVTRFDPGSYFAAAAGLLLVALAECEDLPSWMLLCRLMPPGIGCVP